MLDVVGRTSPKKQTKTSFGVDSDPQALDVCHWSYAAWIGSRQSNITAYVWLYLGKWQYSPGEKIGGNERFNGFLKKLIQNLKFCCQVNM